MTGARPFAAASGNRLAWMALGAALLALTVLALVPRTLHTSAIAGSGGYDPALAHVLLTLFALAVAAFSAVQPRSPEASDQLPAPPARPTRRVVALVALLVGAAVVLLYFPPFLARYGPFGEDKYFLSVLQRMQVGQRPYTDFEFIYGPLLIQPLAWWTDLFGYSLQSYYSFLALVEATTFAALAAALVFAAPSRRTWLPVLAVALLLLVNDNLGVSWIALRRLLPVVILLLYAWRGRTFRGSLGVAALVGVQCLISIEYAAASIAAILATSVIAAAAERRPAPLAAGAVATVGGIVIAGALAFMLLGGGTVDWLSATWNVIALRGAGEASFPFGMSVNAFAVIALLFLACARIGVGIHRIAAGAVDRSGTGDRFLIAAVVYAVIAAKSGLARSDMYHLVPPVLGLVAAAVLPLRLDAFGGLPALRRASVAVVALICVTYAPGLVGAGRIWGGGLARGAVDVLTGRPSTTLAPQRTRGPHIGAERTWLPPAWIRLAEYLADDARAAAPVVYYEGSWNLDRYIGVAKPTGIYATDDYLVSDDAGLELRDFLAAHTGALIVIERTTWDSLNGAGADVTAPSSMFWIGGRRSLPVRFLEHWSSSHYGTAVLDEASRKRDRWGRTVGTWVRDNYVPIADFDNVLVLGRAS